MGLFNGITADLFPGVELPEPDYTDLDLALRANCAKHNLQPTEYFLTKCVQLYEMIIVRHGLMLVGQPFSGKSAAIKVLAGALTDMHAAGQGDEEAVQCRYLNPKSVTLGRLYGESDEVTQEWRDGVLAVYFRALSVDPSPDRKWMVMDGPVDAIWIENMNTVLDDNKKLCLPSSEIIQMSDPMSMIFEVGDLAVASPATVSRCGMVYLEPHQLGWRPLMTSWLATLEGVLTGEQRERVEALFEWMMPACLRFVRRSVKEMLPTMDANLARSCMATFANLLGPLRPEVEEGADGEEGGAASPPPRRASVVALPTVAAAPKQPEGADAAVDAWFLFSMVWSVGCTGLGDGRAAFDAFLRELSSGAAPAGYEGLVPKEPPALKCDALPAAGSVYDLLYELGKGWQTWESTLVEQAIPAGTPFGSIIIPTDDSARYTFLLDACLQRRVPVLLCGPSGTGKSVYVTRHLVKGLPSESFMPIIVSFSARTSAQQTQEQVDGRLDKRRRGVIGPPMGKRAVVFVDDLNMPTQETYGAQPPIELLRQFADYGGWYGQDNEFKTLADVQLCCAMGPPGGGRNPVTPRFLRHFNIVGLSDVTDATLGRIFCTILQWHFTVDNAFTGDVVAMGDPIVQATLAVYTRSMAQLLPTPSKSHYVFSLRDFARVVQGLMLMRPSELVGEDAGARKAALARMWVHEASRVFFDRLTDNGDRDWLLTQLEELSTTHFGVGAAAAFPHITGAGDAASGALDREAVRSVFFGSYMTPDVEPPERKYAEIQDVPKVLSTLEEYLADFNGLSKRPMNLAIFLYCAEHISRICRLLSQPGGSMLLVGVGGSGRQSLTKLAAFIMGMEVVQVEISKSYSMGDWHEDMQKMLTRAGGEGVPTVFLFSDTSIKFEAMVEEINGVLNSGEIPNLFPTDQKMAIIEMARSASAKEGLALETQLELWGYFVARCRANFHVMFCMSPIGAAFRDRLRQYPSLVNCCTIDWFTAWPSDALEAVASMFLKDVDLPEAMRPELVESCKVFHQTVQEYSAKFLETTGRHNYVTPTSYLELISAFKTLLVAKREETTRLKSRYEVGLEKLASSAEQVAGMQEELTALKPQLITTVGEVEELLAKIEKEKEEVVEPQKAICQKEEAEANQQAAAAKAIKDDCEAALGEAMPALEAALKALDTIKPADIKYISGLKNPPGAIKLVMEAVCVLLQVKPDRKNDGGKMVLDFWGPSLKLLNDKEFLGMLKNYDKDNVPPAVMKKFRDNYLSDENFTPEKAKNASSAAEGMCHWAMAMAIYDKVAKVVAPKRAELAEAEASYALVVEGLQKKQAELKELMDKLATMEADLEANVDKKENLQKEVELCTVKLERAEKLIGGLGGEKTRWTEAAETLGEKYTELTGDMLISAGVISYLGAFTGTYRNEITSQWSALCVDRAIPSGKGRFSLGVCLGEPVKIREWNIAGLPSDAFSVDNGIIVANARRWPLMIDPQGQANKFVKNLEKPNNLQVIKLDTSGSYLRTLENAIQFGLPVLLENVAEELDPSLEPLLLKQVFKSGGVNCIRLGDSTIEYSSDFRFYITTKLRNPHYLPEISVKVSLLNFTITLDGLSDQLLGVVVAKERPDLEASKNELVVQGAANARKLKEIEDKILHVLSSSEGNILEDETAIAIITEAKSLGNEIAEKQVQAEITEKEIDAARENYAPCGKYTAVLFFAIGDLANIEPMYQYSLPWFVNLFVGSIVAADASDDVELRLQHVNDHFTYSLYVNICRSLFEKDKLMFAFLLCSRILGAKGRVREEEWMFLLTGGMGAVDAPNPAPEWLSTPAWTEIMRLGALEAFSDLPSLFKRELPAFKEIFSAQLPHQVPLPAGYDDKWDAFRKLLLVRCLRPDKVVPAVQDFVEDTLGKRFIEPLPFDLEGCYADSSATVPLVFVLSAGSDPTAVLFKFAADRGMEDKVSTISLGQGQGPKAERLIAEATANGGWVVLQNCHLAPSWMSSFEQIVEDFAADDSLDPAFRLWCTSYPSPDFPVAVLQNSVKITNEPPRGLRANIKRSYGLDPIASEEFFEGSSEPGPFKKLLFGLCFFHAVIQERRKFGPLGWNIPYGFDDGDLRISVRQLRMLIDENPNETPFKALLYMTGECNYGGRVTDDKDRRTLNVLLANCYNSTLLTDPNYKLSASGLYFAIEPGPAEAYAEYVSSLPVIPMPEAFGLHANADITKDNNDTKALFVSLLGMTSTSGGGGGGGGGTEAAVRAVAVDILAKLPADFDIEAVQEKYPVLYEQSFNTVLTQEMTRFNKLTSCVRTSLKTMIKAIDGTVVMSSTIEGAYNAMMVNQVPELWNKVSYPSRMPLGAYVTDLLRRLKAFQDWFETGIPAIHWLPSFFFVQSFLTAGLQNYARENRIPIDMVAYDYDMLGMDPAQYKEAPEDGVYIHGLFLEGAGWDAESSQLCESAPAVLFCRAPCIWLRPEMTIDIELGPHYECPLYRTIDRRGVLMTTGHSTNFVMMCRLPSDKPPAHWIGRGVAMLTALDREDL